MVTYAVVALITALATLALLFVTKIPTVVVLIAATIVSGGYMGWARLSDGYWDKFAFIAVVFLWFFTAIVSTAFLGLGRFLKWPFFLGRKSNEPTQG